MPVREVTAATEEALAQGRLVAEGPLLRFRHDLLRQAVYDGLTAPVKHALHREAGAVLAAEGRPAAESATHVAFGARRGTRRPCGSCGTRPTASWAPRRGPPPIC
ncbi:hypothetical protein O1L60_03710 [Streptomyces diastatochromogenes]|nr:hypothetical protein [Streptomyces diastatochromogenes]